MCFGHQFENVCKNDFVRIILVLRCLENSLPQPNDMGYLWNKMRTRITESGNYVLYVGTLWK